jgi:hypothetical protein
LTYAIALEIHLKDPSALQNKIAILNSDWKWSENYEPKRRADFPPVSFDS